MKQYEMFELTYTGIEPTGSQAIVDVKATFTINGKSTQVDGFYAGDGIYKVRFLPKEAGTYQYKVSGLVNEEGTVLCVPTTGDHGMVHADELHFRFDDGTWYYPSGTTVYALVHQDDELVDTTMRTLKEAEFNKIRFCLFPKHYDYNHNEPKFYAFEKTDGKWDVHKPCFAFWDNFEKRIIQLQELGIQGDLILFHPYDRWGFASLTKEDSLVYLDYLLRRFSAIPNLWWSLANEYDLMGNYKWQDWIDFAKFITAHDPYHHLLSNHNCFSYFDFSLPEITHCCIQDINMNEVPELQRKYHKPVVFDECRYEGNILYNWGNLSAQEMTHRFWTAVTYGGYCTHGETYLSDDEILWWSRGGKLKGESYKRIAFLRSIMEELPGPLSVVEDGLGSLTVEEVERMKVEGVPEDKKNDFFISNMVKLPKERILFFLLRHRACLGHYGEKAYLRYMEKECSIVGVMDLPENGKYRVEVIDTWEMTRKVVAEGVSGHVKVDLPGKECMAMLAVKTN